MSYNYTWYGRLYSYLFRDLPNFFKNIWKFRKALWSHHWWDSYGTLLFIEIGVEDISKNLETKGIEFEHSRLKKVEKMNRVVEILKNIRESRYFDIVETELGRKYDTKNIKFIPFEGNSELHELVDYNNEEQKEFNRKFFKRVTELEEQEWIELWEIMKGQDYDKFDKEKDFDDQFDGTGLRGWWD